MPQTDLPKSSLGDDVAIAGSLNFKGELIFDGRFEGEQITGSILTVGENADIKGNIVADHLTIMGAVKGNVSVAEKCDLKATARLFGDLKTSRLVMADGATFVGSSHIAPKPANVVNMSAARKVEAARA